VNGGVRSGRSGLHARSKTARELTIGRKLREIRDERHLTQQDMASRAGVPRTYISRIENARLLPGPVMLRRIANALDVTILDLLPQNTGGSPIEGDAYWAALSQVFLELRTQDMVLVLEHVRAFAVNPQGHAFAALVSAEA
jgi:transcriptional regulator with XRE-family HTH domain